MKSKKVTIGHPILNDETGEKGVLLIGPEVDVVDEALKELYKLREENKSLKEKLKCKEILKQGMPKDTDFVILTKKNYDRQQKDIEIENIEMKSRIEKTIKYNKQIIKDTKDFYRSTSDVIYSGDCLIDIATNNLNILQNGGDNK